VDITIGRFNIDARFYNQWINPFKAKSYNWIDFTFISIGVEFGTYTGKYLEIHATLLGLSIEIEISGRMSRALFSAKMDQEIAAVKEELQRDDDK